MVSWFELPNVEEVVCAGVSLCAGLASTKFIEESFILINEGRETGDIEPIDEETEDFGGEGIPL